MEKADNTKPAQRWTELDGKRQSFIRRCEDYAGYTLRKVCLPEGYDQETDELQNDWQSLGAQAVNHLSNKLMLSLFAPSRPFFRLDPSEKLAEQIAAADATTAEGLQNKLAQAEASAIRELDRRSLRPKLYDAVKHIIVVGNVLLVLEPKTMRTIGIKNYVVKRATDGTLLELVLKEKVHHSALEDDARAIAGDCPQDEYHKMYTWVKINDQGNYDCTKWIDDKPLPAKYNSRYTPEKLPYRALTWDLASGDDYGTGLVEEYKGDFAALSILSQAIVQAAVLASEFRWLVNPAGATSPEDFQNSANGAALAGVVNDITLLQSGKSADLQTDLLVQAEYVNRIGRGFLLQSAVTRHAERVTAEEIRANAEELESSLGGAYSRIAVDMQVPLAFWLLKLANKDIGGSDFEPTIVTGLAALSRAGDRDNLVLFLQDITMLATVPPDVRAGLRIDAIVVAFATARGLNPTQYTLSAPERQQNAQQQQAQVVAQEAGVSAAQATGQRIAQE